MRYLSVDDVLRLHSDEVYASSEDILNLDGLASAVGRPASSAFGEDAFPEIDQKAAALFEALIQNHPFIDGNKRTAVIAASAFYGLNGYVLRPAMSMFDLAMSVANHEADLETVAQYFAQHTTAIPDPNL